MNYVELINAVLFDLNETTIAETAAGLSGTRGVQTTVKKDINRVWVHRCTLDHKTALKNYLGRGMKIFKEEKINISA